MCLLLCFAPGSEWVARSLFLWSYQGDSYQRSVPTDTSSQMSWVILKKGKHGLSEGILLYRFPMDLQKRPREHLHLGSNFRKSREKAERCGRKLKTASKGASEEEINAAGDRSSAPLGLKREYLEYAWEQPNGWAWPDCCISLMEKSFHLLTFSHPSLPCVGQACSSSDRDNREKKRDAEGFVGENSEVIPGKRRPPSALRVPPGPVTCLEELRDIHESEGDQELKMCWDWGEEYRWKEMEGADRQPSLVTLTKSKRRKKTPRSPLVQSGSHGMSRICKQYCCDYGEAR